MTRSTPAKASPVDHLRNLARQYPEVEESIVCNRTAFKAKGKAFLFVGTNGETYDAMVKLGDSLPEATQLAAHDPEHYKVGGHDWVTVTFRCDERPPAGLLERWIAESFRRLAPKKLVAQLGEVRSKAGQAAKRQNQRR